MGQYIGEVAGFAVGVAISPFPVIAVILMLFTPRARVNGPVFALGWIVALVLVSGVAFTLADAGAASTSAGTADTIAWGKVVFGVALLAMAARTWRGRPPPGQVAPMPAWMTSTDSLTAGKALISGFLLAGANPKNLMLSVAAGSSLASVGATGGDAVVSLVVFVALASLTILGPVVYYLVGGTRAERALGELKQWIGIHNAAVMAVLLVIFGVDLLFNGLGVLA